MNLIKRLTIAPFLLLVFVVVITNSGCGVEGSSPGNANIAANKTPRTYQQDPALIKGTVVHISDGDTFIVETENGERTTVRIHAIDAPELSQSYGNESREALRALIANQQVEVKRLKLDQYHRVIGSVFLDEKNIGPEMLKQGNVWYYRQFQKELSADNRQAYAAGETSAKDQRLGLWSDDRPAPPWDYRRDHENPHNKR
jgi:endonuclease YncB( thermonuclease family)